VSTFSGEDHFISHNLLFLPMPQSEPFDFAQNGERSRTILQPSANVLMADARGLSKRRAGQKEQLFTDGFEKEEIASSPSGLLAMT
jgi:hypothetical protein